MNPKPHTEPSRFAKLYERPLPFSLESEMAVLGAIMLDPRIIPDVAAELSGARDFYDERHGAIYFSVLKLADADPAFELVQLVDTLRDAGKLDQVGGPDYLMRLVEGTASAAGGIAHARSVAGYSKLRRLIDAGDRIAYAALNHAPVALGGVQAVVDEAEGLVFQIAQDARSAKAEPSSMEDLMQRQLEQMGEKDRGGRSVPTGLVDLDRILGGGLYASEFIIVAARPSMGKTALCQQIGAHVAKSGTPTSIHSLEMDRGSLAQRFLSSESGVDSHAIRTGHLSERDMEAVREVATRLSEWPLYVDDTPNVSLFQLRASVRRMVSWHKVGLVVIDYLQLMTSPENSRENRQIEVSAISRGLKGLARETGLPVLVLSQLNRQSESREGHRPRMSDLRESGSLEQDADVVALLHREDYFHNDDPEWAKNNPDKVNVAELIIAKQRNGPTGLVMLNWNPRTLVFRNFAGPAPTQSIFDQGPIG